jgi:integrase
VDLEQGALSIRVSKSEAGRRTLPLTAAWIARLQAHWAIQAEERSVMGLRWKEQGYVFPGETGAQLSEAHSTKVFHRILRRAGLCTPCLECQATGQVKGAKCAACAGHGSTTEIRVHDLRHTAITDWIADGADPKAAQALAGHSSADVTMDIYAKARGGKLREAMERTEAAREKRKKG